MGKFNLARSWPNLKLARILKIEFQSFSIITIGEVMGQIEQYISFYCVIVIDVHSY